MFLFGTNVAYLNSSLSSYGVRPMKKYPKQVNVKPAAAFLMLCLSGIGLTILSVAVGEGI
jgi:hypothetical protein